MKLDEFEKNFFSQKRVDEKEFDNKYFEGKWRNEVMSYDIESRRTIEGKNPELIIKNFQPNKAIDIGCGPGCLVGLLEEKGFRECYGVDISKDAIQTSPKNIQQRLSVGNSTSLNFKNDEFDLVICREVLEHLTIREIFNTVKEMARLSSKYIYVTTRFHQNPKTIFDFDTDFETDPTHITCLNIEMLRLMFVLNGFKRNENIENEMDWLNKKRVLVYQKN